MADERRRRSASGSGATTVCSDAESINSSIDTGLLLEGMIRLPVVVGCVQRNIEESFSRKTGYA
jgi:hypothetical protein